MTATTAPPRFLRAILRRTVPSHLREEIEGDAHELYVARRAAAGRAVANVWYATEVASFAMRFTIDRVARSVTSLIAARAVPSAMDLRLGARILAKSPGLAIAGGLGLAVAVALGTSSYAVSTSILNPELPLHEGDRVIALAKFDYRRRVEDQRVLHDFIVWRRELRSVIDLGAFRTVRRNVAVGMGQGEPIELAEMSASGFRVARVAPHLGRTLVDADERPDAPPVLVIGYDVWQARFAGDRSIIGREVRIGRTPHAVVGVMPEHFGFPVSHQYWIPLRGADGAAPAPGTGPELQVFGRLAPGATRASAQAELSVVSGRIAAAGPTALAHLDARVVPYSDIVVHAELGSTSTNTMAQYIIGLLLVVVAANVAVLVYARTVTRMSEIAVRTALGATRGRIVAQLFAEALILAGFSSLAGLAIAAVGLRKLDAFFDESFGGRAPFWMNPGLSMGTVVYALALGVVASLIIGVVPALRATGAQLRATIGSLGSGTRARLGHTWTVLIVSQVAVAVAILPPALLKSARTVEMATREPGFATAEYLSTRFSVERDSDVRHDGALPTIATLVERLRGEPGIDAITISADVPWETVGRPIEAEGGGLATRVRTTIVDTGYFAAFRVPVLAGRGFASSDLVPASAERPVVVNRSFVVEVLGGGNAVGRRVRYGGEADGNPWRVIVGVVEDFPSSIPTAASPSSRMMYSLAGPDEWTAGLLMIRLRGRAPESFAPTLRGIATSVDPTLQLSQTAGLDAKYRDRARDGTRLVLVVAMIVGSVLLLTAVGIHALVAFTVNRRRREIGVYAALGAPRRRIISKILWRAMRQLAIGVAVGLIATVGLDTASGDELMNATGVMVVSATAVFMVVVGLLAAAGPVRRALGVSPTEALRAD